MSAGRATMLIVAGVAAAGVIAVGPGWLDVLTVLGGTIVFMASYPPRAEELTPAPASPANTGPTPSELSTILDCFAEGVLLLDEHQSVIATNDAAARILGRPREGMEGVSLIRAARDAALLEFLRDGGGSQREISMDDRTLLITSASVEVGAVRRVLTLEDVTALRRAERARQELVGNVSHELRTPIAAARALAETLESGVDEDAQRARFHEQLTSELERLGSIVDRLLRLSRIESGTEEVRPDRVDLRDMVDEARRRIGPVADRKSITIDVESVEPLIVRADRERMLEVLANLLDNAIRYSSDGDTVRVAALVDGSMARVSVSDQGPGILPRDRLRVFERFYTGDRSRGGPGVGTGLGLAIARHIVSRHGGEIWVSDATPGTTICLTLPLDTDRTMATEPAA